MTADAAPARTSPRPRKPINRLGATIGGLMVLAIIVFLILFRWNWLRGPLAHVISGRLNRPVHITGNLEVHPWSFSPRATVNGLVIGNAPWAPRTPLATLPRLTVQIKILPLFQGKTILPLVEADNASLDLLRDDQGRANWDFHPGQKPKPLKLPAINNLIIKNGAVRYLDAKHHLDFAGTISSNERVDGHGQGSFMLDGKGSLNTARFLAQHRRRPSDRCRPVTALSVRRPRHGGTDQSAARRPHRPPVQLCSDFREHGPSAASISPTSTT